MARDERDGRIGRIRRLVGATALALAVAIGVLGAGGMDRGRVDGPMAGTGAAPAPQAQVWAPGQPRTSQAAPRRAALPVRVQVWAPGQPLATGPVDVGAPPRQAWAPGQPRG